MGAPARPHTTPLQPPTPLSLPLFSSTLTPTLPLTTNSRSTPSPLTTLTAVVTTGSAGKERRKVGVGEQKL